MSQYVVITPQGDRFGPTDFQTLTQWAVEGRVAPGMTVQDVLSGQTMPAASVPGLFPAGGQLPEATYYRPAPQVVRYHGMTALILGIVAMVAWCLPLIGLPVGIGAIIFGARSLRGDDRTQALIGLILGITGTLLSIGNMILGVLVMNALKP